MPSDVFPDPLMHIAIVHYHLRPGGVTRVIRHSVRALMEKSVKVAVLSGSAPEEKWPCPIEVIEGLNYERDGNSTDRAARVLTGKMKQAASRTLGRSPEIWHIHNHALGKNPALTLAVRRLVEEGQKFLLQIHDFAEDGRPELYRRLLDHTAGGDIELLGNIAYPRVNNVHYAVLNQRDANFLLAAGADKTSIHRLPNPVVLPENDSLKRAVKWEGKRRFLYPTRALRRKNIGEALFWSGAGKPGDSFALTLAPTGRRDLMAYDSWKKYARRRRLPVLFEVGMTATPLGCWMKAATAVITTSVAEGFGLAFLEPWLAGRPVAGRNLPEITNEFRESGVRLNGLYDRLEVPLAWVGPEKFRNALVRSLQKSYRAYGRPLTPDAVERAHASAVRKNNVDFGRLNERLQMAVIERLQNSPRLRSRIRPMELSSGLKGANLARNAGTVAKVYNQKQYGARLVKIYRTISESRSGPVTSLSAEQLLDQFLDPERFCLLRT